MVEPRELARKVRAMLEMFERAVRWLMRNLVAVLAVGLLGLVLL